MKQLIIPCSGRGSRFHAVTDTPKFLIPIAGRTMLDWATDSMIMPERYEKVVITLHRDAVPDNMAGHNIERKVRDVLEKLSDHVSVIYEAGERKGAASSVLKAKRRIEDDLSVAVWNCDQYLPEWNRNLDKDAYGWILTFKDPTKNPKWSYVKAGCSIDHDNRRYVMEVREKEPISDMATVGAYIFKTGRDLMWAIEEMILNEDTVNGEYYMAPAYNYLISLLHRPILPVDAPGMEGLGTPEDVDAFCINHKLPSWRKK